MIGRRALLLTAVAFTASFDSIPVQAAGCEMRLRPIIAEHLDVPAARVVPAASFADLGADSLDLVEIVMAVAEEFKIDIPDEKAEGFCTVGDLIRYIDNTTKACR